MGKLLKRKKVFKGKLLELYLERQKFPNGHVVDLEVVRHPGAVLIVPFLNKNRIVFIKQYRPVVNSRIWELPAGTLRKDERKLACAKRELAEEIGYRAKVWKRLGFIYPAPGYATEKIAIYAAYKLEKVQHNPEEDEIIVARVFSKMEIRKLLDSKNFIDAKSIAALAMAGVL